MGKYWLHHKHNNNLDIGQSEEQSGCIQKIMKKTFVEAAFQEAISGKRQPFHQPGVVAEIW